MNSLFKIRLNFIDPIWEIWVFIIKAISVNCGCLSYQDSDELFKSKFITLLTEGEFAGLAFAFCSPLPLSCRFTEG